MKCPICGRRHTSQEALAHMLVGHGPLAGASIPKRRRTWARLAWIHRRLEAMGLSEVQAHQVITIVAEELRNIGAI